MTNGTLRRRLAELERACNNAAGKEQVSVIFQDTGEADWMYLGEELVPCPDARRILAEAKRPIKLYIGVDPRLL
jgi:hypothetical protein